MKILCTLSTRNVIKAIPTAMYHSVGPSRRVQSGCRRNVAPDEQQGSFTRYPTMAVKTIMLVPRLIEAFYLFSWKLAHGKSTSGALWRSSAGGDDWTATIPRPGCCDGIWRGFDKDIPQISSWLRYKISLKCGTKSWHVESQQVM